MKDDRFEVIVSEKSPEILIVTPLRKKDRIDNACENSIIKGQKDCSKVWVSFKSKNSASFNRIEGYKKAKSFLRKNLPQYILFCDNDIVWESEAFRKMINVLSYANENMGYVYCGFTYDGYRNYQFPARPFDPNLLIRRNFISTMSIQKMSHWKKYGKLDLNLYRYQDWDCWLNYLINHKIHGVPCYNTGFKAISTERDISMKPDIEYKHLKKVIKKYGLPITINLEGEGNE